MTNITGSEQCAVSHHNGLQMNTEMKEALVKVPQITLGFWVIKILATTLGETGGDAVSMSMDLGYLIGTVIFMAFSFLRLCSKSVRRNSIRLFIGSQSSHQLL